MSTLFLLKEHCTVLQKFSYKILIGCLQDYKFDISSNNLRLGRMREHEAFWIACLLDIKATDESESKTGVSL